MFFWGDSYENEWRIITVIQWQPFHCPVQNNNGITKKLTETGMFCGLSAKRQKIMSSLLPLWSATSDVYVAWTRNSHHTFKVNISLFLSLFLSYSMDYLFWQMGGEKINFCMSLIYYLAGLQCSVIGTILWIACVLVYCL